MERGAAPGQEWCCGRESPGNALLSSIDERRRRTLALRQSPEGGKSGDRQNVPVKAGELGRAAAQALADGSGGLA